ncbi:hypothetical protein BDEG_27562 [Batrachochytrium dendrobatidis JEL423]|uniref:Uncharacterized protein n=1 Tax=Batrachochytrium dendrobatidis (strain JEL423) TaxID=403673 RepID=A0A177WW88_BATDL|nr:hypothetical protein BDEG_27562 [Batrachochytrium dendrobatidis JEL423]
MSAPSQQYAGTFPIFGTIIAVNLFLVVLCVLGILWRNFNRRVPQPTTTETTTETPMRFSEQLPAYEQPPRYSNMTAVAMPPSQHPDHTAVIVCLNPPRPQRSKPTLLSALKLHTTQSIRMTTVFT